jgi:hypothetical protein
MDYHEYINSKHWKAKRVERLIIDGYQCAICKDTVNLSVHHLHYETLGNEDARNDLIAVCQKHHRYFDTIERFQRYQKRLRRVDAINQAIQERKDLQYGMVRSEVQIIISVSNVDAQRADSRSDKQVVKVDQTDFIQASKDR